MHNSTLMRDQNSVGVHGRTDGQHRSAAASAFVLLLGVVMAGCVVTPKPMSKEDISKRVEGDRKVMYVDQEPIADPINFHEAAARALKYNLDYRLKLMESALSQGLLDVSRYDMLPKLLVGAGYVTRNNAQGGRSIGIESGVETLVPSSTQERDRTLANADLSWNILDFGLAYYRSKQQANQVLIAEERRRKVAQTLMQDVRNAYWRAAGAQRLIGQVDSLLSRSEAALERARQIEQQGLIPQPQALGYQRALLDATVLLQLRRQDLELSQTELAALMNLPPGTKFKLADEQDPALPGVPANTEQLEDIALSMRPELREEDYRKRITRDDIRRAMISTLPGISFNYGWQYDSNRFLYNKDWMEGGIRLSFNIFRLLSLPALSRTHKAQEKTDDTRRMALSMAILTQTRVAQQRYGLALADLKQAGESARVDQRLLNYAKSAQQTRVEAELETIRAEARAVLSEYQRHIAYSNAQAAWGRLYNSVGLDVLPEEIEKNDVKTLAKAIERTMSEWEKMTFKAATADMQAMPPVEVVLENIVDPNISTPAADGIRQALKRYGVPTVESGQPAEFRLVARLDLAPVSNGTRRARWDITMLRANGEQSGRGEFTSVLGQQVNDSSINALAQSLIDAHAAQLPRWLDVDKSTVADAQRTP